MNGQTHLTDEAITAVFERRSRRAQPDGLYDAILGATAAAPQRWAWRVQLQDRLSAPVFRPAWVVLFVLAALLGIAVALAVAGLSPRLPFPTSYHAIFLRGGPDGPNDALEIVAVRAGGDERSLGSITAQGLPPGSRFWLNGSVSPAGWLALNYENPNGSGLALVDLRDRRQMRLVPTAPGGWGDGSWGPDGRFAAATNAGVLVADPESASRETYAETTRLSRGSAGPGGSSWMVWTADGTGLLTDRSGDLTGGWAILPIGGGPARDGLQPLYPPRDPPWLLQDGTQIQLCHYAAGIDCGELAYAAVVAEAPDGTIRAWYGDELAPGRAIDASFFADGRSVWLLMQQGDGRELALARLERPGSARIVTATGRHVGNAPAFLREVASNESLVAVGFEYPEGQGPTLLLPTDGGAPTYHDGRFAGFLSAAVVDALPGGVFAAGGLKIDPDKGTAPTLPSMDELVSQVSANGHATTFQHSQEATGDPGARAVQTELVVPGSVDGLVFGCLGSTEMTVEVEESDARPVTSRCLGGEWTSWPDRIDGFSATRPSGPVRMTVTASPTTAWRIIAFDDP